MDLLSWRFIMHRFFSFTEFNSYSVKLLFLFKIQLQLFLHILDCNMSGSWASDSMRMLECSVCKHYPKKTALESLCCSQVMCKTCVDKIGDAPSSSLTNRNESSAKICCPLCKEHFKTSPVRGALKRIIDNVSIACENGCGVTLMLGKIAEHEKVCPKKFLICNLCDGRVSRESFVG